MSFTENHLFFDDVEISQEWMSPGRTVTQTDIVNFAGLHFLKNKKRSSIRASERLR